MAVTICHFPLHGGGACNLSVWGERFTSLLDLTESDLTMIGDTVPLVMRALKEHPAMQPERNPRIRMAWRSD